MSKAFLVYMTALVNALKMTYVNLGSVKRGVCKLNDRLRISLLFIRVAVIRLNTIANRPHCGERAAPRTMRVPLASGGGPGVFAIA